MNGSMSSARIAFQGERGAFSEEAAIKLLGGDIQLVPRPTFAALFRSIADNLADYVLAPIENSLAGSIQRSYDLLLESCLLIVGEVVLPVAHNLIGCPGASFDSIETVQSHATALAQCENFFAAHPRIKRVVADDTAGSVAEVIEQADLTHAAIAGRRAAGIYGGAILREHLEDHPQNYTRFVLLGISPTNESGANKLSLLVELAHAPGALQCALAPFARHAINLVKIESRPIKGEPWQYHFYLDLDTTSHCQNAELALADLERLAASVRVLGRYKSWSEKD
jgi:prephenate dehydratase